MKVFFLNLAVVISFLSLSFSNLLAQDCYQYFSDDDSEISSKDLDNRKKEAWIKVKEANFENSYFSDREKLTHRYLNAILDMLLSNNRSLLEKKKKTKSDFIVLINEKEAETIEKRSDTRYSIIEDGLIELKTSRYNFQFIPHDNDILIAASLSREIVRSVNLHSDIIRTFEEIGIPEDKILEHKNIFELETDELGFSIYANAGFPIEQYKELFLMMMELDFARDLETFMLRYGSNWRIVYTWYDGSMSGSHKRSSVHNNSKICLSEGKKSIAKGTFDNFMNQIRFDSNNNRISYCWRYWNMYQKELEFLNNIRENKLNITANLVGSPLHTQVELSYPLYIQVKEPSILNTKGTKDEIYENIKQKILNNENLNYSLIRINGFSDDKVVENSDRIFVRANDLFKEMMFLNYQIKDYDYMLENNTDFRSVIGQENTDNY